MRALVTGGAGFIGSHLVRRLLAEGCQVRVLDDLSSGDRAALAGEAELMVGDVRDSALLRELAAGCQRVFHLAAFVNLPDSFARRDECLSVNVDGTRCVLEAALAQGVEKVVFSSTSALYPEAPEGPKYEDGPLAIESPYAESKLAGEHLLWEFGERGLDGMALRYFNVFGPGQPAGSDYAAVIPLFIVRILEGHQLSICGDGRQTRDFVYVEDVAAANWHAAQGEVRGVYNVGTGRAVAILELADIVCEILETEQAYTYIESRPGDVLSSTASIERTRQALDWRVKWSLEAGLRETVKWWRAPVREMVND